MDRAANRERRTSSNPVQRRGSACGLPQELGPARRVTCGRIESRVRIYRVGCEATRVGWNVLLTLPEWAGRRQLGPGRPRWVVRRRGLRVGFVPRRSARPPSRYAHAHSHAHAHAHSHAHATLQSVKVVTVHRCSVRRLHPTLNH